LPFISAELASSKMASGRPAVGRMAARFFNSSHSKAYSSLSKAIATRGTNLTSTSAHVSGASIPPCCPTSSLLLVPRRYGHTVRIILKEDLPDGRGYSGDVMTVKAGYARNFLVPKKMALYATPENFARLGVADPEAETMEEKRARLAAEAAVEEDEEAAADLRAADILKHYLRNKVVSTMSAKMHAVPDGACAGLATVVSLFIHCESQFIYLYIYLFLNVPFGVKYYCIYIMAARDQAQRRSVDGRRPSRFGQRAERAG